MLFASPAVNATGPKATRIDLFSFKTPQMRAFHVTWLSFFVCFFAWFALAPLLPIIKAELHLTDKQIFDTSIASVAVTILVRMIIGPLCDKFGPKRTYTCLLLLGSLPVFGAAFINSYESLLFVRLCIGAIGASFVITQYHTSVMFAPNVVGTANATVGGWGNAGGGVTQTVMPILATLLVSFGVQQYWGWRVAMVVPGVAMVIMAFVYARFTQDTPQGDIIDLRAKGISVDSGKKGGLAIFLQAASNYRVWMLAAIYAASFGVELFIHNVIVTYYVNKFTLSLEMAGLAGGVFGILALFARALGGIVSDRIAISKGLDGRTTLLFGLMLCEGIGLLLFSYSNELTLAILSMSLFGLFTHMAAGATYAVMPFIDRKALGGVAGLIGAGGNVGGVIALFIGRGASSPQQAFTVIGIIVVCTAFCAIAIRFSPAKKAQEQELLDEAIAQRRGWSPQGGMPISA